MGVAEQWQEWLPDAMQLFALLIRPVAFMLRKVHDAIRNEMPVCPASTSFFALIPALTQRPFLLWL